MKKILLLLTALFVFSQNKAQVLNTSFCQANGAVNAVAIDSVNNVVYIGGNFSQVCGIARNKLAAMNLTTGAILPWNPGANGVITALYVHNKSVYVGGNFITIGGQSRKCAAKFAPNGTITSWNPAITIGTSVNSIVAKGNRIFLGGDILMTVGSGNQICELDTGTATPVSWAGGYPNSTVYALAIDGNSLYVGGNFTQVGPTSQNYIAKFQMTASGGVLDSWAPEPDARVNSLCAVSGRLFAGGYFSTFAFGNDSRQGFAELDTATALVTGINPGCDGGGPTAMVYRKGVIYLLGAATITTMGGKARTAIGAIDVNNGIATRWNINVNSSMFAAATTSSQIYLGGSMPTVLGQTRTNFAVVCINPIDTMQNGPTGETSVCAGANGVTYSVSPVNGATTYTWTYSGTGATITGNTNTVSVNFSTSATSGTLSVVAGNGCETSNTQTLAITTYSFSTFTSVSNPNITCGDSTDISAFDTYGGSGTVTYSWAPSTGLTAANISNPKCGAHNTTDYTVTATTTEGCTASATASVTVIPYNLTTSYLSFSILCSTKDSLHVRNDYVGSGVVTYTWAPAASVSSLNGADISVNPVVTTDYTVTSSATGGCFGAPQVVTINVDPITLSTGSSSSAITCGESTQLSATNNYPGAGTLTYTWTPSTALSNTHITNPDANPTSTTVYTLTMNSPEGCVTQNNVVVNVNPLQVNTGGTYTVNCHQPVVLSTNANTNNPNLTYSWSPSAGLSSATSASPTAIVGSNASYNVTMSLPSSGCNDAYNSVSIVLSAPNTPQICMVTVDSASTHNIVYWDKTGFAGMAIDSFRIYREVSLGTYSVIGSVHYNMLSEFHDYGANPNVTTYRYKITALDSCGLESQQSLYHNTIYIVYVGNGQYTWNPGYTIEPTTNPVNNYLLMRDDNNDGTWHQVASTVGNQNTIADPAWASFPNANWQVVTSWNISCTPTARSGNNGTQGAIVKSKSNITNNRTTGVKNNTESNFNVYPNPTNGNITIAFMNSAGKTTIRVTSLLGEEVYNETILAAEKRNVDLSKYENGVYTVQVTNANGTFVKRIIKNN